MKQFFFATALLSGALVFSADDASCETAAAPCPAKSVLATEKEEKGQAYVYLTNNSDETISVEWAVMLSPHKKSTGNFYAYPDTTKGELRDKMSWMVDADYAKNCPVYMIEVKAKEGRGGKVLAEKKMEVTLGPKDLVGKNPANVCIRYDGKCRLSVFVDN